MQYMQDANLRMTMRGERGLNVNDITGERKTLDGRASLSPLGSTDRAVPFKPRIMGYDIVTADDSRFRMTQYGRGVLSSRQKLRSDHSNSPVAGRGRHVKVGERSIG